MPSGVKYWKWLDDTKMKLERNSSKNSKIVASANKKTS